MVRSRRVPYLLFAFCAFFAYASKVLALDPIMVDIDNPKFRQLIVATPQFASEGNTDSTLTDLTKKGKAELDRVLEFTSYFRIMDEAAYKDLARTNAPQNAKATRIPGFPGVDPAQWKGIGVECLVEAKTSKGNDGKMRVDIKAADIHRGEALVDRFYTFANMNELEAALKNFVDRLLMRYTGKPGIFSSQLVFIGKKHANDEKQVFTCDIDGHNVRQITTANAVHLSPSWSPDRSKLLFTSYRDGNPDLFMHDLMANTTTKVAHDRGINSGGVFSPNGKLIVYTGSVNGGGDTEIFAKNPYDKGRVPLIQGHGIEVDPSFSNDGQWLTFVSGRFVNPHIFLAKLEWSLDGKQVKVKEDKRMTFAGWWNANPAPSPDGTKIAFAGFDKDIGRFDLFWVDVGDGKLERLTVQSGDNESPTWSPNGQLIAFHSNRIGNTNQKGNPQLWIMNRDGSNQRKLDTGLAWAQTPKWSSFTAPTN